MKRTIFKKLEEWKISKDRKPLIIQGARQVGKTWLMKKFGNVAFEKVVYLNFESSSRIKEIFIPDFNMERIITVFEIETGIKIDSSNTLIILDEIQEAEKGLTALKYFQENAPEFFVVAAGSLLGVSMQNKNSFPVGKVDFLQMYPMSFFEFLDNLGESQLTDQLKNKNWDILNSFHNKLVDLLRTYYFIGGMPEVVSNYIQEKDLDKARNIQKKILRGYENDFAKHAPNETVPKIRMVWRSLIGQLAKENKKFIYGQVRKGSRAKDFESAINWLVDAGLILKVNRVNKPTLPINAYADFDAFKLFLLDIGLLNAIADLDSKILLEKNKILKEYKGALTEQFVCQQLKMTHELYYWVASNATAEIDFLIQYKNEIIPIEVKAEENLKSKSLKSYAEKYIPKTAIRSSMSKYREEEWLTNLPLYAIEQLN